MKKIIENLLHILFEKHKISIQWTIYMCVYMSCVCYDAVQFRWLEQWYIAYKYIIDSLMISEHIPVHPLPGNFRSDVWLRKIYDRRILVFKARTMGSSKQPLRGFSSHTSLADARFSNKNWWCKIHWNTADVYVALFSDHLWKYILVKNI